MFIEFLRHLLHNAVRKIILIVDGHPTHKAKSVRAFADAVLDRLEIVFLPPYAPQLNPDELVWNDLKNNALGRKAITTPEQLKREVSSFRRFGQQTPERVRSYWHAPTPAHAAM